MPDKDTNNFGSGHYTLQYFSRSNSRINLPLRSLGHVTLAAPKLLALGKEQINLPLRSLIRNFVPCLESLTPQETK